MTVTVRKATFRNVVALCLLASVIPAVVATVVVRGIYTVQVEQKLRAERIELQQKNYDALVTGCHRGIADRLVNQGESRAAMRANLVVARDPRQPAQTRKARLTQAMANAYAIRSRAHRLPPELNCETAFPRPR
jgi:hypothetical protein